jgi:hypothetical protein
MTEDSDKIKNWLIKNKKTGQFWNGKVLKGWTDFKNAELFSSDQFAFELPHNGRWVNLKDVTEETKTAKTPEKPSGKAAIIGSTKPYREPKVLGPTDKVKSVGKILGGKPKINPSLSTKSFGTCSANNDPGDKAILGEISWPMHVPVMSGLPESLMTEMWQKLASIKPTKITQQNILNAAKEISYTTFAKEIRDRMIEVIVHLFLHRSDGLALRQKPKHNVYEDELPHERQLANEIDRLYQIADDPTTPKDESLKLLGKIQLLYAEAERLGYVQKWEKEAAKEIEERPDIPELLDIRDDLQGYITHAKTPNKADLNLMKNMKVSFDAPSDSRWLHDIGIAEGLTYKEFKNASRAVSKNCPVCNTSFKNVHAANQKFCSSTCEQKDGGSLKLKESFSKFSRAQDLLAELKLSLGSKIDKSVTNDFMQAWWKATQGNPFNDKERIVNSTVGIECYPFEGNIHLSSIRSFVPGQGGASVALDEFLKLADSFGLNVECDPKPFGNKGLNKTSLTNWYKRHGFVSRKGYPGALFHEPTRI